MAAVHAVPLIPKSTLDIAKADLEVNGFALISGVYSPAELEHLRFAVQAIVKKYPDKADWLTQDEPTMLFWAKTLCPVVSVILENRRMVQLVRHFLGPKVTQVLDQAHFRKAEGKESFGWHQDITFRVPKTDFMDLADNFIQTVICIDDMRPDNGGLEFIPGSHKQGELGLLRNERDLTIKKFNRNGRHGTQIYANAGDVIVWSLLTVHGSDINRSKKSRMTYLAGFAKESSVLEKKKFHPYPVMTVDTSK